MKFENKEGVGTMSLRAGFANVRHLSRILLLAAIYFLLAGVALAPPIFEGDLGGIGWAAPGGDPPRASAPPRRPLRPSDGAGERRGGAGLRRHRGRLRKRPFWSPGAVSFRAGARGRDPPNRVEVDSRPCDGHGRGDALRPDGELVVEGAQRGVVVPGGVGAVPSPAAGGRGRVLGRRRALSRIRSRVSAVSASGVGRVPLRRSRRGLGQS